VAYESGERTVDRKIMITCICGFTLIAQNMQYYCDWNLSAL